MSIEVGLCQRGECPIAIARQHVIGAKLACIYNVLLCVTSVHNVLLLRANKDFKDKKKNTDAMSLSCP